LSRGQNKPYIALRRKTLWGCSDADGHKTARSACSLMRRPTLALCVAGIVNGYLASQI